MTERRLLLVALVAFVATGGLSTYMLSVAPGAEAGGDEVVRWFTTHQNMVRWAVCTGTLGAVFFATLIAILRASLPAIFKDVFLLGAIMLMVQGAVQFWVWAALALRGEQMSPEVARGLLDVAIFFGPTATGAFMTMISPVAWLASNGRAGLPRWFGIFGLIVVSEQAIETMTIFGSSGFTAPGGPMNMQLGGSLTVLWTISFALLRVIGVQPGALVGESQT